MAPPEDAEGMRQLFDAEGYGDDWIMVTGRADARDASPVPRSSTTGFTVERVYRGHAPEQIVFIDAEDGLSCGMTVPAGGRQFVVARLESEGMYEPTFCGSFGLTPILQAELDTASGGYAPAAAGDTESDLPFIPVAFTLGGIAVLVGAWFALRRRRT